MALSENGLRAAQGYAGFAVTMLPKPSVLDSEEELAMVSRIYPLSGFPAPTGEVLIPNGHGVSSPMYYLQ